MTLEDIGNAIRNCRACGLCQTRTNAVPGEGDARAPIMFVGEGPGANEDEQGRPFVGAAGQLLTRMIASIGLGREAVFIANIVKCRPPGNREPADDEAAACLPFLRAQFSVIRPRIIVCLGRVAATYIIGRDVRITRDRGVVTERKGVKLIPTFHPSALLRDPARKREAWEDLKRIKGLLEETRASGAQTGEPPGKNENGELDMSDAQ